MPGLKDHYYYNLILQLFLNNNNLIEDGDGDDDDVDMERESEEHDNDDDDDDDDDGEDELEGFVIHLFVKMQLIIFNEVINSIFIKLDFLFSRLYLDAKLNFTLDDIPRYHFL